ncbi:MAG: methionine ABC transporter permease, partial [Asticcacaulis sp.]
MSPTLQTLSEYRQKFAPNVDLAELLQATLDTLLMLGGALVLTLAIGLPLGVILYLTARGRLLAAPALHAGLGLMVNILRAVPFVILLILLIPVTVALVGTSLGVQGAIVPLVIGTAPFFARLVEAALKEVDHGVIEASQAMGARPHQIVFGTLLPEALPGLLAAGTVTAVALVSYT